MSSGVRADEWGPSAGRTDSRESQIRRRRSVTAQKVGCSVQLRAKQGLVCCRQSLVPLMFRFEIRKFFKKRCSAPPMRSGKCSDICLACPGREGSGVCVALLVDIGWIISCSVAPCQKTFVGRGFMCDLLCVLM